MSGAARRAGGALLLAALAGLPGTPGAAAQATTVVLVRHAEKADGSADAELSAAGRRRAEALKAALARFAPDAILVSEYRRTAQTAAPTAAHFGLTPTVVPVRGAVPAQATATAAALRGLRPGSTALVVGHSNTIGPIIAALGGPALGDLCDGEYATIFVLTLPATGPPRLVRAVYGTPDAPESVACHPETGQR